MSTTTPTAAPNRRSNERATAVSVNQAATHKVANEPSPPPSGETLFLEHLQLIETLVRSACLRRGLGSQEIDELRSQVFEHLIENDYRALRRFQGKSKPSTYFAVIIQRLLVDSHYRRHGRWRPTAAARRLGNVAIRLETLLHRDGFSPREAIEILAAEQRGGSTRAEIQELYLRLPSRPPARRFVACDPERLHARLRADTRLEDAERCATADRIGEAIAQAFGRLDIEERLVLKLRFRDGLKVRDIARTLGRDDRELYRLCARCLAALRRELEARGLGATEARSVIGWGELDFNLETR